MKFTSNIKTIKNILFLIAIATVVAAIEFYAITAVIELCAKRS